MNFETMKNTLAQDAGYYAVRPSWREVKLLSNLNLLDSAGMVKKYYATQKELLATDWIVYDQTGQEVDPAEFEANVLYVDSASNITLDGTTGIMEVI